MRGIFPLVVVGKRTLPLILACAAPFALAACGGSKSPQSSGNAEVQGPAFRFQAPAGWKTSTSPTDAIARRDAAGTVSVSVSVFRLQKPYDPKIFAAAAKELDSVAAKLATQSRTVLTKSETITVDGERIRAYRLTAHPASGASFDERIGFVLRGRREYQLLCRAPVGSGDPDNACALLYSSFTTASLRP